MLPWAYRLYFWGVHGIFTEVIFTSSLRFVESRNWRLDGGSSIWSFLVYGLGVMLVGEPAHNLMLSLGIPLLLRCLFYVVLAFAWEFTSGVFLDQFVGSRPWDYSHFRYNIKGLITMEYIPAWYIGGLYFEFLISNVERVELLS